jgi:hypothetical protein
MVIIMTNSAHLHSTMQRCPETRATLSRTSSAGALWAEIGEPLTIFISYARQDSIFAWSHAVVLRAMGHNVIFDRLHLMSGDRWRDRLKAAIDGSHICLLIWSKHAVRSPAVRWEVECVRAKRDRHPHSIRVLPVVLGAGLKAAPLPAGFEELHFPEPPSVWLH